MMRFFRDFKQLIPVNIMILYTRSTPTTNIPFLKVFIYTATYAISTSNIMWETKLQKKMTKRVAGRVELSERAVMIFYVVCKYTHTQKKKHQHESSKVKVIKIQYSFMED